MYDYHSSPYWKEYIKSLDGREDAGIIGFCEYLSNRLEAAQQSQWTAEDDAGLGVCPKCVGTRKLGINYLFEKDCDACGGTGIRRYNFKK